MNELMRIVDIDEEYVYLQALEASNCSSCAIKGSCNLTGDPNRKIKAINSNKLHLNKNEFVYIKKIDSLESKVAFIMYGIPLLTMVIITVLLFSFGLNEIISFILGLTGMLISYYFIHLYDKKVAKTKYVPEIIEKVGIYRNFQI
ncbi:SoxR reducing system RseC family protein [Marinitoga litoralis]|uniref:SoxR reducing system RseC family protein n=1 Tax=Marinitoga litoralis TaxID=570855 RepID=UPI00196134D5|nr:SoxR reducing system RseC family protein [Marinitoga litoralis]MBM7559765.1 sigma-E factor negative regulatory protein RseC [Marinitoga litoralis]